MRVLLNQFGQVFYLLCLGLLMSACTMFDPAEKTPVEYWQAEMVGPSRESLTVVEHAWWQYFERAELSDLIEGALTNNLSLMQYEARLRQAAALARSYAADRLPSLAAEAEASVSERSALGDDGMRKESVSESYSLGLAASYELDVWGRLRAAHRSKVLDAAASSYDYQAAAITLSAEMAATYMELMSTRETLDLLRRQHQTAQHTLELTRRRLANAQADALDVLQQEEALLEIDMLLPPVLAREKLLLGELAVLSGYDHSRPLSIRSRELPQMNPLPEIGMDVGRLEARPDILAAWSELVSDEWGVSRARAARLPALSISSSASYSGETLPELLDNWLLNLAGNLTAPLFQGGAKKAEVVRTGAIRDESLAAYKETVAEALLEIYEAVVQEAASQRELDMLSNRLTLASEVRKRALDRYRSGQEAYLQVLTAAYKEDGLRRTKVTSEYERLLYRIQLCRALGGIWPDQKDGGDERNE